LPESPNPLDRKQYGWRRETVFHTSLSVSQPSNYILIPLTLALSLSLSLSSLYVFLNPALLWVTLCVCFFFFYDVAYRMYLDVAKRVPLDIRGDCVGVDQQRQWVGQRDGGHIWVPQGQNLSVIFHVVYKWCCFLGYSKIRPVL